MFLKLFEFEERKGEDHQKVVENVRLVLIKVQLVEVDVMDVGNVTKMNNGFYINVKNDCHRFVSVENVHLRKEIEEEQHP